MPRVKIEGFMCYRCRHKWVPRDRKEEPKVCPKCKSPYWNKLHKRKKLNFLSKITPAYATMQL